VEQVKPFRVIFDPLWKHWDIGLKIVKHALFRGSERSRPIRGFLPAIETKRQIEKF
jgi:hypothetical protein